MGVLHWSFVIARKTLDMLPKAYGMLGNLTKTNKINGQVVAWGLLQNPTHCTSGAWDPKGAFATQVDSAANKRPFWRRWIDRLRPGDSSDELSE